MDSSDWRHQGYKEVNNPHNNIRISSDEDMCYMLKIQGMWIFT